MKRFGAPEGRTWVITLSGISTFRPCQHGVGIVARARTSVALSVCSRSTPAADKLTATGEAKNQWSPGGELGTQPWNRRLALPSRQRSRDGILLNAPDVHREFPSTRSAIVGHWLRSTPMDPG